MSYSLLVPAKDQPLDRSQFYVLARKSRFSSRQFAQICQITQRHLERIFQQNFERTPQDWLNEQRMVAARYLLKEKQAVKEVAWDLGFSHSSHFDRHFKTYYEMTPKQFLQLTSSLLNSKTDKKKN